jgi:hypothetical protein
MRDTALRTMPRCAPTRRQARGCNDPGPISLVRRRRGVLVAIIVGGRKLTGGIMDVLLALIFGFILGAVVGYGIRENISRRRHAAVAAREERRRKQLSDDYNPPRPE